MDIATALEMSPGHLYYHFRGKGEIVVALLDAHEAELALVLQAALEEVGAPGGTLKTFGVHVRVLLEEMHDMRFLFREASAITHAWPDLKPRYRRLFAAVRGAFATLLEKLEARKLIRLDTGGRGALVEQIVMAAAFQPILFQCTGDPEPPRAQLARTAAQIEALLRAGS
jgi:AcrR family transcriptional regulator